MDGMKYKRRDNVGIELPIDEEDNRYISANIALNTANG